VESRKGVSLFQKEMNVQALMLKRGFMMAAGTMAYAALMQDDESYKNATPEQRALNWFIPLPGVEASLRVPIPFELGYAFKSIPEMVFNVAFGDQKAGEAMKAFGALAYQTVPVGMPQGMKPIVEIQFSDFTAQAMDQIVNQAAKIHFMLGGELSVPLVLRAPSGSGTGAAAQHSQSLEAWFAHVPGLKVVMPSSPYEAKGLLLAALDDPNPVIFLEHKLLYKNLRPCS